MANAQQDNVIDAMLSDLAIQQPIETALCIGSAAVQNDAIRWQYFNATEFLSLPFTQRFDLGLVFLNLLGETGLNETQLTQMLVKLRDLMAKRLVVVAVPEQQALLRALGLTQILNDQTIQSTLQLWQFNILTYKHVPDWFNSKFWANPENWDKFRW